MPLTFLLVDNGGIFSQPGLFSVSQFPTVLLLKGGKRSSQDSRHLSTYRGNFSVASLAGWIERNTGYLHRGRVEWLQKQRGFLPVEGKGEHLGQEACDFIQQKQEVTKLEYFGFNISLASNTVDDSLPFHGEGPIPHDEGLLCDVETAHWIDSTEDDQDPSRRPPLWRRLSQAAVTPLWDTSILPFMQVMKVEWTDWKVVRKAWHMFLGDDVLRFLRGWSSQDLLREQLDDDEEGQEAVPAVSTFLNSLRKALERIMHSLRESVARYFYRQEWAPPGSNQAEDGRAHKPEGTKGEAATEATGRSQRNPADDEGLGTPERGAAGPMELYRQRIFGPPPPVEDGGGSWDWLFIFSGFYTFFVLVRWCFQEPLNFDEQIPTLGPAGRRPPPAPAVADPGQE